MKKERATVGNSTTEAKENITVEFIQSELRKIGWQTDAINSNLLADDTGFIELVRDNDGAITSVTLCYPIDTQIGYMAADLSKIIKTQYVFNEIIFYADSYDSPSKVFRVSTDLVDIEYDEIDEQEGFVSLGMFMYLDDSEEALLFLKNLKSRKEQKIVATC